MKKTVTNYTVYTDGACRGNPGPGGWGAVVIKPGSRKEYSGFCPDTTNNRMELTAAINGLLHVPVGSNVILYTDSVYVKNGITTWVHKWREKGDLAETTTKIKNVDLWLKLCEQERLRTVEWRYVKGHSGNVNNELADYLATRQIKRHCVSKV